MVELAGRKFKFSSLPWNFLGAIRGETFEPFRTDRNDWELIQFQQGSVGNGASFSFCETWSQGISSTFKMAHDLTSKVAPFLDKHLVFPLLEFVQEAKIYPEEDLSKAKLEILAKTNMVDYAMDIYKSLYNDEEPKGLLLFLFAAIWLWEFLTLWGTTVLCSELQSLSSAGPR